MATQDTTERTANGSAGRAAIASPFLNVATFEHGAAHDAVREPRPLEVYTPFSTELFDAEHVPVFQAQFYQELAELEDSEFDKAVAGLVAEAHEVERLHLESELAASPRDMEAVLAAHFLPLQQESEALLAGMSEAANAQGVEDLSEGELDELFASFEPQAGDRPPAFDEFLGKLFKKAKKVARGVARRVKKVAKKAARLAAKFSPVALALRKLRKLVRPLIQRVLKMALNRLPTKLQPLARRLAKRFLREAEYVEFQGEGGDTAVQAVHRIQQEFDLTVAEMIHADDEAGIDNAVASYQAQYADQEASDIETLRAAREAFIDGFEQLEDGADPQPLVEQFIPAVLGALRLGVRLIGRRRVVGFLSGQVSRIVARFVPRDQARALSTAMVDAGLKLVNLEATDEDVQRSAGGVIADTIEETVRRVASLDDAVLDDDELLQDATQEALNAAAAAHFPPGIVLPHLRETASDELAFQRAGSGEYDKYPSEFPVTITPDKAASVISFRGETLARFLQRVHAVAPGTTVRATAQLYQARPGTWLSKISRDEGMPGGARRGWQLIHPLTPEAAAVLLGRPRLGVAVEPRFLRTRDRIAIGQRFYYLRLANGPQTAIGRPSEVNVVLDLRRSQLRAYLFLSEAEAQDIAARLRSTDDIGAAMAMIGATLRAGLGALRHHIKIIPSDGIVFEEAQIGAQVGSAIVGYLTKALMQWLHRHVRLYLSQARAGFAQIVADPLDGVTIAVTIDNPAGLGTIREALRGNIVPLLRRAITVGQVPDAHVRAIAGFANDG